jgi:small subunit ribosomal protein S1
MDQDVNQEKNLTAKEGPQAQNAETTHSTDEIVKDEQIKDEHAQQEDKGDRPPAEPAENSMEQALDEMSEVKGGAIVKGRVVNISQDEVYIDIGHKSDGIVPLSEFGPDEQPEIGQTVKVLVKKMEDKDGNLVISKRQADAKVAWDDITEAFNDKKPIKARVLKKVKGGLDAIYKNVRCFVPGSLMSDRKEYNLDKYVGGLYEFAIVEFNRKRNNVVLSRKQLLEEQEKTRTDKLFSELAEGKRVKGVVKGITEYGAFVDIGGLDGLLHITDMSWGHLTNPSDAVSVGSELEVVILHFDREKSKVSLGLKQLQPDPWTQVDEMFAVDQIIEGRVKNLTDFGAFVTLADGIDGLVHISDLSWTKKSIKPKDVFKVAEQVKVMVLAIDKQARRISLGVKQLTIDPWTRVDEMFEVNSISTGRVKNLTQFGAFIELDEGIEGLVHISDMSWTKRVAHPSEVVSEGDIVEVKILSIDKESKKISLGLKQVNPDPWLTVTERFSIGTIAKGKITNLKKFGAFVELEEGVEGLVHVSDLSWTKKIDHPSQLLRVGDETTVKVIGIDQEQKKISLGIKQLSEDPWVTIAKRLTVNSTIDARVTHFTKFGAFLEVEEGIEGLLHTSDLSWTRRVTDPSELLEENKSVKVKVLAVDTENRKISLGLKQLSDDPLAEVREWMDRGKVIEGRVKSLTEFGAFVEIKENVEGLVHISQLSDERVAKVDDVVKVGDVVRVKILEINSADRKLKLSIKAAIASEQKKTYSTGDDEEVGGVNLGEKFKEARERNQ